MSEYDFGYAMSDSTPTTQREPTKAEIAKFKRACKELDELGRKGFYLYLANDGMNLMIGPSHDDNGNAQQDDVRAHMTITGAGGGDW